MNQVQIKNDNISFPGFILEKNGIQIVGNPSFEQWEEVGKFIQRSHEAVQFWRGDWLNYGEHTYDQWTQYFGEDEASLGTLRNEKWVASKIPPSRRRDTLSWSHHYEVAELTPEEQEEMLTLAEKNKMSVATFRKSVRAYKQKLDLWELSEEELKPTDPKVFETVQGIIDSSIHTIEMVQQLDWASVHNDALDYLLSHLKRAGVFYFEEVRKHDKQKRLSSPVVSQT